jgi:hypothetical protein
MKKAKDEPVAAGATIPTVVVGDGSQQTELESNKEANKKQGTLRKIFTRKQSEMYVDFYNT